MNQYIAAAGEPQGNLCDGLKVEQEEATAKLPFASILQICLDPYFFVIFSVFQGGPSDGFMVEQDGAQTKLPSVSASVFLGS